MAKDLKKELEDMLQNMKPYDINEYFAVEFSDDYDEYEKNPKYVPVLEYLNDEFIDIDIVSATIDEGVTALSDRIIETIKTAIRMLEAA